MIQKKRFHPPNQFLEFNSTRLNERYFEHFHINSRLQDLVKGHGNLFDLYNIVDQDHTNVMALWTDNIYYLYADNWNKMAITVISNSLNIDEYEINLLRGQKYLIEDIVKNKNLKGEILNDRIIYDCQEATGNNPEIKGKLLLGNQKNYEEILKLNLEYYKEDFEGQGVKSNSQVEISVLSGIQEKSIYTWEVDEEIVSTLRVINNDQKNKMIGGMYTSKKYRKKGYASELLKSATNHMLKNGGEKCGLLTERSNIGSNKAVNSAKYQKRYEWVNFQIIE